MFVCSNSQCDMFRNKYRINITVSVIFKETIHIFILQSVPINLYVTYIHWQSNTVTSSEKYEILKTNQRGMDIDQSSCAIPGGAWRSFHELNQQTYRK